MKIIDTTRAWLVSYRRDEGGPSCTNIVIADTEDAIKKSAEYAHCAWLGISRATAAHDIDAYMRRGMPVVEIEDETPSEDNSKERSYSYDSTADLSIWIGNLRKYNEGELSGDWVTLPVHDMEQVLIDLGIDIDRDEYHIPDWECSIPGLEYFEYADLDELNDIAEQWADMPEWEREAVGVRMELCGEDFETACRNSDDVRIWHGCTDMADVAAEYCEECGLLDSMPENLRFYFDYEALGRDMEIEGTFDYSADLGCMVEAF